MLQAKFQSASRKVDNQRPFEVAVAVSAHNRDARSDRPQFIKNRFRANISKMPDFISVSRHLRHALRQTIVRVCENEHTQRLCGVLTHTDRNLDARVIKTKSCRVLLIIAEHLPCGLFDWRCTLTFWICTACSLSRAVSCATVVGFCDPLHESLGIFQTGDDLSRR
jgi:hypothetical protein